MEYIIVGGGYAGMFFAHQLIKGGHSFKLFNGPRGSASKVSAGIVNPVVLKKFTTFDKAKEQIDSLEKTLKEIESYTGEYYGVKEPIHRIFHDRKEQELWLKKSEDEVLKDFLDPSIEPLSGVVNPEGSGRVLLSSRLDVAKFFQGMEKYLREKGHLIEELFDYFALDPEEKRYQNYSYNHLVFAEGMGVSFNPFFKNIEVNPNKGHHLTVRLSEPLEGCQTLKKKHFLFPLGEGDYYYGGTYDRESTEERVDLEQRNKLTEGLSEFYKKDFQVQEVKYGFRPTVKDRRPIIGRHPVFGSLYVFNGLGARGILNGNFYAKALYEHISQGYALSAEVEINRFS